MSTLDLLVRKEYHIPPDTVEVLVRKECVDCGNPLPDNEDQYEDEYGAHCAACLAVLGDFS